MVIKISDYPELTPKLLDIIKRAQEYSHDERKKGDYEKVSASEMALVANFFKEQGISLKPDVYKILNIKERTFSNRLSEAGIKPIKKNGLYIIPTENIPVIPENLVPAVPTLVPSIPSISEVPEVPEVVPNEEKESASFVNWSNWNRKEKENEENEENKNVLNSLVKSVNELKTELSELKNDYLEIKRSINQIDIDIREKEDHEKEDQKDSNIIFSYKKNYIHRNSTRSIYVNYACTQEMSKFAESQQLQLNDCYSQAIHEFIQKYTSLKT